MSKSKIVTISIAAIVIIGGAFAAWYFLAGGKDALNPASDNSSLTESQASIQSACQKAGGDADLCGFYAKGSNFTKTSSKVIVATGNEVVTMEYDGKGNYKYETKDGTKMVFLNNRSYVYDVSASTWYRTPVVEGAESQPGAIDTSILGGDKFNGENEDTTGELFYDKIGDKTIDGQKVVGYKIYGDSAKADGMELWFSKSDHKIYQMKALDENGDVTSTMDFTYGAVEITEPSPVKDLAS